MINSCFKYSRFNRVLAVFTLWGLSLSHAPGLIAQQPADDKLPRIGMSVPLAIPSSGTTKIALRGWLLDQVSEVKLSEPHVTVKILKQEKVGVPNKQEAKHVGDTQLELEVTLSEGTSLESVKLIPMLPAGAGPAYELLIGSRFPTVKEQEPNQGFVEAQLLAVPQVVEGQIDGSQDVDVFAFEAEAGHIIQVEVLAAARGSALDASLTLYDSTGRPLAFADDQGDARDPRLRFKIPATGRYHLALQDGLELGGSTHPYLLHLQILVDTK